MSLQERIEDYASQLPTTAKVVIGVAAIYGLSYASELSTPSSAPAQHAYQQRHFSLPVRAPVEEIKRESRPALADDPVVPEEPLYFGPE